MTDMKRWIKLQKLRALSQLKSAAPLAGMRWPMLGILCTKRAVSALSGINLSVRTVTRV
jgi:hypothetical protein